MKSIRDKKEKHFTAFFEKNELNGYTVTVPSLPGLVTEGKTFEEVRKMTYNAVKCYIQGLRKSQRLDVNENETGSLSNSSCHLNAEITETNFQKTSEDSFES